MEKTKIKKILKIWLPSLLLVIGIQALVFFMTRPQAQTQSQAAGIPEGPAVLGAATDIRGQQAAAPTGAKPVKTRELDVTGVTAKSYLVYDAKSGETLTEKKSNTKYAIASLTKLLTALVAYDKIDLNAYYEITKEDRLNVSPVLNLKAGDKVQGWDLFNAMLVGSANDAAKTLSRLVAEKDGKGFAGLMNDKAKSLGMADSRFSNPLGFDSQYNYSTAEDLRKLVEATQELSVFSNLGRKTSYSFTGQDGNHYRVPATNKLVSSHPEVEAVKTGFTENSKGAMISKITKDGHKIVIIVLASLERESDTLKLSEEVFKAYEWQE